MTNAYLTSSRLGARSMKGCALHWLWFVLALASMPLLAFFGWLGFNLLLAKWHGLEALDKTPQIYRPFRPQDWAVRRLPVDPAQQPADPQPPNQLPPAA